MRWAILCQTVFLNTFCYNTTNWFISDLESDANVKLKIGLANFFAKKILILISPIFQITSSIFDVNEPNIINVINNVNTYIITYAFC